MLRAAAEAADRPVDIDHLTVILANPTPTQRRALDLLGVTLTA